MVDLLLSDKPNIVTLDDRQHNLLPLAKGLSTYYEVTPFLNGDAFMAYLETKTNVSLILISIDALNLDSKQVFERLRSNQLINGVPIILSLSLNDKFLEATALALDASDYLTRPYSIPIAIARMKKLIYSYLSLQISSQQNRYLSKVVMEKSQKINRVRADILSATNDVAFREQESLKLLSRTADIRDPETGSHLKRMAHYAELIAKNMGLSKALQTLILEAAPLHDIGKVGIPDDILLYPGKHSSEKTKVMQQHALIGYEILRDSSSQIIQAAAEIALAHHEKYDGSGYPNGLMGENIPLYARIVAVADVFDALTSQRPYKKAWPLDDAVAYLQEHRGNHFDPVCVDAFLKDYPEVIKIYEKFQEE